MKRIYLTDTASIMTRIIPIFSGEMSFRMCGHGDNHRCLN